MHGALPPPAALTPLPLHTFKHTRTHTRARGRSTHAAGPAGLTPES